VLGAVLLSALGAAGCGLLAFDVGQDIPAQTVPGSPIGALLPASLFSIPMNVDIQSETAARGTGPARSATLSSLTLATHSSATFEFLSSIAISISASGGANLPQKEIARLQPVPATSTIAIPATPGVDLLPYIKQGATITATASGHMPASDVSFDGRVVITVHL
jgi:hypothetical protein